jgi:DNA-binding NtrC family response regulator
MTAEGGGLELVVAAGPDLGARVALGAAVVVVGREREAGLRLTDLSVSRRHLEARAQAERVLVQVLAGAAPMLVDGVAVSSAELAPGQKLVVGGTTLAVVHRAAPARLEHEQTREVTDVRSLLGEAAVDARGLRAIFELSEELDRAEDVPQLETVVAAWARRHARAEATIVHDSGDEPAGGDTGEAVAIVQCALASGEVGLSVPLVGIDGARLDLRLPAAAGRLGDELRRLLAVAGRVVASGIGRLRALRTVREQNRELRRIALGSAESFLGTSAPAHRVVRIAERLAASDAVALLCGETGVGKSFLARLIHEASPRARDPFRVINCAAIPENLVEAELFGHERGAFTGAVNAREGALEAAAAGTLLLDEIGDLPLTSQAKLLRVLEERQFERIGSNRTLRLRARLLAATNRDLKEMVERGTFRSDLYFRITVVTVPLPSLRERRDDIAMLAERFLADLVGSAGRRVTGMSPATLQLLRAYAWPGNVRELRNVIEHALVLGDGPVIEPSDLPAELGGGRMSLLPGSVPRPSSGTPDTARALVSRGGALVTAGGATASSADEDLVRLPMDLALLEGRAIQSALRATGGNRTKAAALLGINRVTLYKKLREEERDKGDGEA